MNVSKPESSLSDLLKALEIAQKELTFNFATEKLLERVNSVLDTTEDALKMCKEEEERANEYSGFIKQQVVAQSFC